MDRIFYIGFQGAKNLTLLVCIATTVLDADNVHR